MSRCDLDLWPAELESSWYIKCQVIKVCKKFERYRAESPIILWIFAHDMSRCDLDVWPQTFTALQVSCVKRCIKCVRNRIINGWVIDDLAGVFACNFRGWSELTAFSGVCGPNSTKLDQDTGRSSQHCTFASEFWYLAAFSNAGGSQLSDVLNDAKFPTFWPRDN